MVIITNKKHYRRVSNDGQRTNFTVTMRSDFDNVHLRDVIEIKCSVLLYQPDYATINKYVHSGFNMTRRFGEDYLWMRSIFFVQHNTLEAILEDFGVGIMLFQNKLVKRNVNDIKDIFLRLDLGQIDSKQAKQEAIDLFARTIEKIECKTCNTMRPMYEIFEYDGMCEKCYSKDILKSVMKKIRENRMNENTADRAKQHTDALV